MMAHHHNNPYYPPNHPRHQAPFYRQQQQQRRRPPATQRPLSSTTVDAEVLTEAEELLNEQFHSNDSDSWNQRRAATKDYRTTKEFRTANGDSADSTSTTTTTKKQSEVINFDPEQPIFKPLKSADENDDDMKDPFEDEYDDFMKFQRQQNMQRKHQHGEHFPQQQRGPHSMPPPPPPGMIPPEFEFVDDLFMDMPPPPPMHHHHPNMMPPPMDMPLPPPPHFFNDDHRPSMFENGPMFMSDDMGPGKERGEENYVDRVDFVDHGRPVNDRDNTGSVDTFFSDRPTSTGSTGGGGRQQQQRQRRGGPSVYTQEEEELIASMGGMGGPMGPPPPSRPGRPSTQEFAEAGTQSAMRKHQQGQSGPGAPPPQYREEGYLGDSTLKEISMDYGVPITYLADVLATWGVPIPIDPNSRLGDMVTGEQAFAILEAIHTLDISELHERYAEDDLMNLCDYYDLDIKEAFDFCMERGWALPFGVRTFLRVEQEEELLDALSDDGGMY